MRDEDNEDQLPDAVIVPIEDSIDLHAFQPQDVKSVVEEYLRECYLRGFREVRIIHGRGTGVQREIVRSVLLDSPYVESYRQAPPEAGGWGATIAVLVPKSSRG